VLSGGGDAIDAARCFAWLAGQQLACDVEQGDEEPEQAGEEKPGVSSAEFQRVLDMARALPEEGREQLRMLIIAQFQVSLMGCVMELHDWVDEQAGLTFPARVWKDLPDSDIDTVPVGYEPADEIAKLTGAMQFHFPEAWAAAGKMRAAGRTKPGPADDLHPVAEAISVRPRRNSR
jgi:hypothetical protein